MKRLTAYVSGLVQKPEYQAEVVKIGWVLKLDGTVENLDDGRVKIIAEGDEDKPKFFEGAIDIKSALMQISSIEKQFSHAAGELPKFYMVPVLEGVDLQWDAIEFLMKELLAAFDNMNENLSSKTDKMVPKWDEMRDNNVLPANI